VKWLISKTRFRESTRIAVSNTNYGHKASFTRNLKSKTDANLLKTSFTQRYDKSTTMADRSTHQKNIFFIFSAQTIYLSG